LITKEEIRQISKITGLKPFQQEKAYIQTMILKLLYLETNNLIFKNDASLFMFYHLPRFSQDLDFDIRGNINTKLLLNHVSKGLSFSGIHNSYKIQNDNETSITSVFSVEGPLYTSPVSRITVKLDFSFRENIILPEIINTLSPLYSDLLPFDVICMNLNEIINEKVRAIYTRNKARDIFDLYIMLKNYNLKLNKNIINEKLNYYNLTFSIDNFKLNLENKRHLWLAELEPIVLISLPDFDDVENFILDQIKKLQ